MILSCLVIVWACSINEPEQKTVKVVENNDKDLGLISVDVKNNKDVLGAMPEYSKDAPGAAKTIDRSFENAPPLIPHSTEGLVPITKANNMCISCHMPAVAAALKATPIPVSHLTNYRPEVKLNNGKVDIASSKKVVAHDLDGKLSMARYNCTQCHVPQAKIDVAIQNKFEAVYRDTSAIKKSNLSNNIKEGVR